MYGLLTYRTTNLGDDIQSIAARQFLPQVDTFINRERLSTYDGPPVVMILNGWFKHDVMDWPPSSLITPIFVGFHLHDHKLLTAPCVDYLKSHGPIGCRDVYTSRLLTNYGIDVFVSGCLTSTLGLSYKHVGGSGVNVVDTDCLPSVPDLVISSHIVGRDLSAVERLDVAHAKLLEYERASLVVTSRLHAYLPCVAMGTPVIHVGVRDERFAGVTPVDSDWLIRCVREKVKQFHSG
jgi:hypothetical protein